MAKIIEVKVEPKKVYPKETIHIKVLTDKPRVLLDKLVLPLKAKLGGGEFNGRP